MGSANRHDRGVLPELSEDRGGVADSQKKPQRIGLAIRPTPLIDRYGDEEEDEGDGERKKANHSLDARAARFGYTEVWHEER